MKVWSLQLWRDDMVLQLETQKLFFNKEKAIEVFKYYLNFPFTQERFKKGREEWIKKILKIL